jgi:hypothetical protein
MADASAVAPVPFTARPCARALSPMNKRSTANSIFFIFIFFKIDKKSGFANWIQVLLVSVGVIAGVSIHQSLTTAMAAN